MRIETGPGITSSGTTMDVIEEMLAQAWGGGDGTLRTYGAATESAPQAMTVEVAEYFGWINEKIAHSEAVTLDVVAANETDIIQFTEGIGLNIKRGSTTPDANSEGLWELAKTAGMGVVENADLTNVRSYV